MLSARSPPICWCQDPTGSTPSSPRSWPAGATRRLAPADAARDLYDCRRDALALFATYPVHPQRRYRRCCLRAGLRVRRADGAAAALQRLHAGRLPRGLSSPGLGLQAPAWLMIHGTTELFAIAWPAPRASASAGRWPFPAERSRVDAASRAGRTRRGDGRRGDDAGVAGLLEGFARQLVTNDCRPRRDRRRRADRLARLFLPDAGCARLPMARRRDAHRQDATLREFVTPEGVDLRPAARRRGRARRRPSCIDLLIISLLLSC